MNETLIDALSGIAEAIRAKGVAGTMNAWEMPTKIEEIQTEKYGIPLDGILGDVDENGALQRGGEPFSFSSSEITSIPAYYFDRAFFRKNIQSIDLPNLTTIGTETFINSAPSSSLSSVSMPELSAIPDFGLQYAFRHCSALESVDLDSVQTVGESGLQGCCFDDPALVRFNAPSISSVGKGGMYRCLSGCTSLEEVCLSSLTSAGNQGLDECFMGCTSLKKVQMPLSYAGTNALRNTFNGCSALEEVDFRGATSVPNLSNVNCFANTNDTYVIYVPPELSSDWIIGYNWSSPSIVPHIYGYVPQEVLPLTFTAQQSNSTVSMQRSSSSAPSVSLEYSTDNRSTWSDFVVGTTTVTLANVGDKMFLRAKTTNSAMATSRSNTNYFVMTGKIAATGHVNSLLQGSSFEDITIPNFCYHGLFKECASLVSAPELDSLTVGEQSYRNMFLNCTSLVDGPLNLPATTLASLCYDGMFQGCTSLTTAPYLPATTLANQCYVWMFYDCFSLNTIKIGYTGNFDRRTFELWMSGVPRGGGTFYYNGSDTSRGENAIPENWTVQTF